MRIKLVGLEEENELVTKCHQLKMTATDGKNRFTDVYVIMTKRVIQETDAMTQKAKDSVKYSLGTLAAEKMVPSRKAIRLCEKIADGRISGNDAVEQIKRSYGIENRCTRT